MSGNQQNSEQNPAVSAIKGALVDIDAISAQKDMVMQEGVAMHDNLNCTEDMMRVFKKTMEKAACFDQYKKQYEQHFARNNELETQRQSIAIVIQKHGAAFKEVCAMQLQDPAKSQFFQTLNDAVVAQGQLQNMLEQGT